jgi:putative membrane protein
MNLQGWLSPEERGRIEAAVAAAERETSGEIVVAVVGPCDEYGSAGWRFGVLLAGLVYFGLASAGPPLPHAAYLAAQLAALLAGHLACRIPALRRIFISQRMLDDAARRRALRAFAEHGLHRTEGATGVLILVAPFEHEVVVLADEGVNRRLDPDTSWENVVDLVLSGIRAGDNASGIVAGVERCGEILSHPLPPQDEPRDEIPRALVIEE